MDLLKLILTYMVVLTGTAVQAVDATPLPYEALNTPSPTPIVTQVPSPTAVPTATPEPTPTPTPRIYVLNSGSRGTSVRNGPKTAEAVKWFQQVNGLEADGVAGRLTQEKMFFDPNVLPAPAATPLQ